MSRVMVVTGASRGIGRAAAIFFLDAGWLVEGVSRGPGAIDHPNYTHARVDLADSPATKAWAKGLKDRHAAVDALICASGKMPVGALGLTTTQDDLTSVFESNVVTSLNACREIAPLMIRRRFGRIVCISSIMTALHARGTLAYSTAKSGVNELAKVFAIELAPLGITCNVVASGYVETESAVELGAEVTKSVVDLQTLKRPITVSELCHTLQFLVSTESSGLTGQVLHLGLVT